MILVTGSTSFVGQHLVPGLAARAPVTCLIPTRPTPRLAGSRLLERDLVSYYASLGAKIVPYPDFGTVAEYALALKPIHELRGVVYLAANNDRSTPYTTLRRDNVLILERFLDALGERLRGAVFVFASSVMAETMERLREKLSEAAWQRVNPYGVSKLEAEQVVQERSRVYGYQPMILRLASVYGQGAQAGLLQAATRLRLARRVHYPGRASLVDVRQAAAAVEGALSLSGGGLYSVANGEPTTVGDLVRGVHSQLPVGTALRGLLRSLFSWGTRVGLPACLQLWALVDDIYVAHSTAPWPGAAAQPETGPAECRPRLAVLGASGLLGSHIAQTLMLKRIPIRCSRHHNPLPFPILQRSGLEEVACDLHSPAELRRFLAGQETLIYAAGLTTAGGQKNPRDYWQANVADVRTVLEAAREAGVTRLLFLGSQASQTGIYGASKSHGEQLVRSCGLNFTILKPGLVVARYGLAARLIRLARGLPCIPVPRCGPPTTELVDVNTVVESVLDWLEKPDLYRQQTIYLGSDRALSLAEIVALVGQLEGRLVRTLAVPRGVLQALAILGSRLVAGFPLSTELVESLYRARDPQEPEALRLRTEAPEAILERYL